MQNLRYSIGSPEGLAVRTDAGQGVMTGVKKVFPVEEYRKYMLHLMMNLKKRYTKKIFEDHLWAAAYLWAPYFFEKY
jgi:hypothetical protein